jgi:hypothetical protein
VGSSLNLTNRLKCYFSLKFLGRSLLRNKSIIHSSILKYGYSNFSLDILEYCEPENILLKEQYFIDIINPQCNLLKTAGLRTGIKLSKATKIKISVKRSINVKIIDTKTNSYIIFLGNKKAAKYLNVSKATLNRYKKSKLLINNRYQVMNL